MLTVDHYGKIRRAAQDGMSIREMARSFTRPEDRHRARRGRQRVQPVARSA